MCELEMFYFQIPFKETPADVSSTLLWVSQSLSRILKCLKRHTWKENLALKPNEIL